MCFLSVLYAAVIRCFATLRYVSYLCNIGVFFFLKFSEIIAAVSVNLPHYYVKYLEGQKFSEYITCKKEFSQKMISQLFPAIVPTRYLEGNIRGNGSNSLVQ